MKNLKLLKFTHVSDINFDCFCLDLYENIYFASQDDIYFLSKCSYDVIHCAKLGISDENSFIIGIEHLIDSDKLFIAASSGDIYLYDIYSKEVSSVGTVDSGLKNFSWSPDQALVVLLTGSNTLILMTKDFIPLEKSLCPDDFGESKPITVGWGSKETQFHGSEGKEAAHIKRVKPKPALSYDDGKPYVSWRGDGEYFVTSSIHSSEGHRHIRIWNREAVLQFTGETVEGLEEHISWSAHKNIIACSQQCANKHKIKFFEKNGLQLGEFTLPFKPDTHRVSNLLWNSDSTILLVVVELIESPSYFNVMLWTRGNYHWYLKNSFIIAKTCSKSLCIKWSTIHPNELFLLHSKFYHAKWTWTISQSHAFEDSLVVAIDNDSVLITPFGQMVVPPPMCAYSFTLPSSVQSVFFAPDVPMFGCYMGNLIAVFAGNSTSSEVNPEDCKLKLIAAGGNGFKSMVKPYSFLGFVHLEFENKLISDFGLCHWTWLKDKLLCVSFREEKRNTAPFVLLLFELPKMPPEGSMKIIGRCICELECAVVDLCSDKKGEVIAMQLENGKIMKLTTDSLTEKSQVLKPWLSSDDCEVILPHPCISISIFEISGKSYFLGLTERYSLYCDNTEISSNCTSYQIRGEFLLVTSSDHFLKCFPIRWSISDLKNATLYNVMAKQRIEKGAKIVVSPPNSIKVILQMPRGNLETIHPRPLVLSCILEHLDSLQFGQAFELSKVHRIDLNILYDHNPEAFLENVKLVVEQINSASNLNLLLASLKNEDVSETFYSFIYEKKSRSDGLKVQNKIDAVCSALRKIVVELNDDRYFQTLIATYAKKGGPDIVQALMNIKRLKDYPYSGESDKASSQSLIDEALNFLLYLIDVNELIDIALGTYDLGITIMVAQKSQKDPKEFLPFYNELQQLEENYRKYRIDMHLQRYKKALLHISKCENHFSECLALIKDQRLYTDALYLFPKASDQYNVVWQEYGKYLMEKNHFGEAGLAFSRCKQYKMAIKAYKEALDWQSVLYTTAHLKYSQEKVVPLCLEMSEKLKAHQKFLDASYLLEHYVKDIEESIVTLVEGGEWNMALLLISKYNRTDICESHLRPGILAHHTSVLSQIKELQQNFLSHKERLKTIRSNKKTEALSFESVKHQEEELYSETDSVTDATSHVESKQLSGSIMTRKSSKSRRKQKLKKYRLKEGSPDEDLALIVELSEIVVKVDSLKDNLLNTLKSLVFLDYDDKAKTLQSAMCKLTADIELGLPEIWPPAATSTTDNGLKYGPDSTANSIAAAVRSSKSIPSEPKPADPELLAPAWRKIDFTLQVLR